MSEAVSNVERDEAVPTAPDERPVVPYAGWFEIARGIGNGHPLPGVGELSVAVVASDESAKSYYCDLAAVSKLPALGIAEVMYLDERKVYYVIERGSEGNFRYSIHDNGETVAGGPLCASCHEHGRPDPLFRALRASACR